VGFARRARARRRQVWADVAAELGGVHVVPSGPFSKERERIEIPHRGGTVTIDTYSTGAGSSRVQWTRCAGRFGDGPGPRLKLYREGVLSAIGKALGTQDVVLGTDPAFDEQFVIKCDEPALVRRLWTAPARESMSLRFHRARVESNGDTIELIEAGLYDDAGRLRGAFELITLLIDQDLYGGPALRALAGPGCTRDPRGRPVAAVETPARVTVRAEDVDGHLATVARLDQPASIDPVTLRIEEGGHAEPAARARALPQTARSHLRAVGASTLTVDGDGARLVWPTVQTDPAPLQAGAALLGALTTAGEGVYR